MRRLLVLPLALAAFAVPVSGALAAADDELAQRYAPVVRVQTQAEPCGDGEPYTPLDVGVVLDNVEVAFRGPWDSTSLVKVAPTAADLAEGYPQYHLDFPGNALDPGCDYDLWSKRIAEGTRPTTYARVVTDPGRPGKLALQYWLFYAYNDYNNKHEGDWEMIQLVFDAADAEGALAGSPTEVGYAQHEGAERAAWDDPKLERAAGTHPVVYAAVGSHASFYEPALFLGRSAAQGVGCDDTSGPHTDLRPRVAVVPTAEADYRDAYPWLGFQGHWGEKHEAFYNGPTGPNTKPQWTEPIAWAEETWRDESFAVPGAGLLGNDATDAFCFVIEGGSSLLIRAQLHPAPFFIALAVLLGLGVLAVARTRSTPASPFPVEQERAWGQMVGAAAVLYRRRLGLVLGLGLVYIPTALVTAGVQAALFRLTRLETLVDNAGELNGFVVFVVLLAGIVFHLIAYVAVLAAGTRAVTELSAGGSPGVLSTYREVLGLLGPLARVTGWVALAVLATGVSIVLLPVAIFLVVRWAFAVQVVAIEGVRGRRALGRSGELVRGRWWRTGAVAGAVTLVGGMAGPLVGILLLLATTKSFLFVNAVSAIVYAVTIPFVAIVLVTLYYDARARAHGVAAPAGADGRAVSPPPGAAPQSS